MFSKTLLSAAFSLGLALQVSAHAAVNPPLGVASGTAVRNDVQRPSGGSPCGNAQVGAIDSSKAVTAAADGTFTVTAVDFNAGGDGSRSFSATVDATGTGKSFVNAQVTKNGNANPTSVGSDQLTVALPAGTKCAGGAGKNKCLVSFKSTAGFGNCVVVQQGAGNAAAAAAPAAAPAAAAGAAAGAAAAGAAAATANKGQQGQAQAQQGQGRKGNGGRKGKGRKGANGAKAAFAVKTAKQNGGRSVERRRLEDLE